MPHKLARTHTDTKTNKGEDPNVEKKAKTHKESGKKPWMLVKKHFKAEDDRWTLRTN